IYADYYTVILGDMRRSLRVHPLLIRHIFSGVRRICVGISGLDYVVKDLPDLIEIRFCCSSYLNHKANSGFTSGDRLFNAKQLDVENKRRVRRNHTAGAPRSIPEIGRNNQLPAAADLHAHNTFVPSFDNPTDADREFERLVSVD